LRRSGRNNDRRATNDPHDAKDTTMTKRIQRSRNDKMIAGVAGGLAQYFGIDATIVRILFLLLLLPGGLSPLIYVILWVVMPEAPAAEQPRYDPYTGQPLS